MIGYHSVSVIADAYIKGIRDFDAKKALKAMVSTANANEFGKLAYAQNGFISSADEPESVSRTLEYAYDDFCIATMANALNEKSIALEFEKRSANFVNLYDPNTKFMRARRGAQWYGHFDPAEVNFNYTEANSWQYSLYAPQNIPLLTNLLGGPDSLELWLDRLFTTQMKLSGREQADITGLIGQYAHGNEPSHHMAYLYNFTNAPQKTQYYVDRILNEMYQNAPDGLSGNEDCGQMSAWYVMSALGLYAVTPGKPVYQIGRPLVSAAKIRLENGKYIQINCNNQSQENKYVKSVSWNGQALQKPEITHEMLMQGGILYFEMSATPSTSVGIQDQLELQAFFAPVPFIKTEQRVFHDSLLIEIDVVRFNPSGQTNTGTQLFYQIDDQKWVGYQQPFYIHSNANISIKAGYKENLVKNQGLNYWSSIVSSYFIKKDPDVELTLKSTYSNQYTASGKDALIDGLRGGNEFRTGDYQGYYNQDVVGIIAFKESQTIHKVGVSFIRDHKSWIFAPSKITIEASLNGIAYFKVAQKDLPQATPTDKNPFKDEVLIDIENDKELKYKYLRYSISNPGLLPAWHLGAGNPTWLFVDELLYE